MSNSGLLSTVLARLASARIPCTLTGSMAAAHHGAGRATMDIDLVIEASAEQLRTLVESLAGPDMYVSVDAAIEALVRVAGQTLDRSDLRQWIEELGLAARWQAAQHIAGTS